MTQKEINEKQRINRKLDGNKHTKIYEKTKKGFLMRVYRNMQSRVLGIQKVKYHLYIGKSLLPRDSFYAWSFNHKDFLRLFSVWEESKYDRRITPSIDRIDPEKGYETENMRWITFSENSKFGGQRTQQLHKTYKKNLKKRWNRGHL